MRIDVITVFPELVDCVARCGITGRATERRILELFCWNPRDYTADRHRTVDDRPYGGGPGMVMKAGPLRSAIRAAREADVRPAPVVSLTPQGRRLDQEGIARLAGMERLILLAGRYEGIDERLVEMEVDEEISIGDYVLSGGELPAMVVIDGCARLLPGALGDEESARQDSFSDGLLDCQHYTRPEEYEGRVVPEVLLGGNHAEIARWRRKQSLGRTWERRPELLARMELSAGDERLLEEYRSEMKDEG